MANTQTDNRTKRRSRRSSPAKNSRPGLPVRVIVDWDAVAKIDKQALAAQVGIGLVAGGSGGRECPLTKASRVYCSWENSRAV